MNSYTQLTHLRQRYQIKALMKMGHNQTEMAKSVGIHKSTVSRELRRNRGLKGYRPKQAHELALSRRCKAKPLIDASTWAVVEALIRLDLSPEQASGWLKDNYGLQISHEWILPVHSHG